MTRELQRALDNRPQLPAGPVAEGLLKGLCQSCREPVPATKLARTDNCLRTVLALCDRCAPRWVEVNGEMGVRVTLEPLPLRLVYDGSVPEPAPAKAAPAPKSGGKKAPPPTPKAAPVRDEQSQIEVDMDEFLATFG